VNYFVGGGIPLPENVNFAISKACRGELPISSGHDSADDMDTTGTQYSPDDEGKAKHLNTYCFDRSYIDWVA